MEGLVLAPDILVLLFVVALVAGCLDTLAGGGGLIALPALILAGLPPLQALGTNKLQGSMGTAMATLMMFRHRRVQWRSVRYLMLTAFVGAASGSLALQFMDTSFLGFVIPIVLVVIGIYFLFAGKLLNLATTARMREPLYRNTVVPLIGWYDGMFGPGAGSFFALSGVALQGRNLLEATAVAKTQNFATNLASLLIFVAAGQVMWIAGIVMMAGQAAGAWLGSHILFRVNPQYLRIVIVLICLAMLTRYFAA
ncbi:MAG: hypothetical protein RLZZ227_374 [Pseudomonadota bacterium]|jgi:uncharacterized membrane protein YfcA